MLNGQNLFLLQIVNNPLVLPDDMNPQLRDLLEGILCKGTVFYLQNFWSYALKNYEANFCPNRTTRPSWIIWAFLQIRARGWHWTPLRSIAGWWLEMETKVQSQNIYAGASARLRWRKNNQTCNEKKMAVNTMILMWLLVICLCRVWICLCKFKIARWVSSSLSLSLPLI